MSLMPFEWKDKPALIEALFPVQKLSVESFKEQMAGAGKTLTALGSYWKGRKPLILNKACLLACLLPAINNSLKDLEVFELLMAMDSTSLEKRLLAKMGKNKLAEIKSLLTKPYNEQVDQAKRPIEDLIDFAVQTAVQFLVPLGFEKNDWQKLQPIERYYLKMAKMEQKGFKTLDNYSNFAKSFKIKHHDNLMHKPAKANSARLMLAAEFKDTQMSKDDELANTPLRALLYAMYEFSKDKDTDDVLAHLMDNCKEYLKNKQLLVKISNYLAIKRDGIKASKSYHPELDASYARILAEAINNQRL